MHPVFQSYPAHPWFPDWRIEPQEHGVDFREKSSGYFFRTTETIGKWSPDVESPEWAIQVPIPQNSQINLLSNGFCGYFLKRKNAFFAEVLLPEEGVLWGRFHDIPAPVLLSEKQPEERDGCLWLESDDSPALLLIREGHFCLVSKKRVFEDAASLAKKYLAESLEEALKVEWERRAGVRALFEQMSHHDSLAVISAETLMKALRPATGRLTGRWSQSPDAQEPRSNANELFALVLAWREIDPQIAEELVLTTLKTQESSGSIPVLQAPHRSFSTLEAPKPLLAKAAKNAWEVRKDPQFLAEILHPLRRYLQWLLQHFDPKRRGLHCWQNSAEPLFPETYQSDLATADLSALLLAEIETLNTLRKEADPVGATESPWFEEESKVLRLNLQTQFWNEETGQFSFAIHRGHLKTLEGLPALVPLLCTSIPMQQKNRVLEKLRTANRLPDGQSLLSWHSSKVNETDFSLLRQLLLLDILKIGDPNGSLLRGFVQVNLRSCLEWQTLALEKEGSLPINALIAAYIISLQENHYYRFSNEKNGFLFRLFRKMKADWFEFVVVLVTVGVLLSVHIYYKQLHDPPPLSILKMHMTSSYLKFDFPQAFSNCYIIIRHYPESAGRAHLLAGNMMLFQGRYKEASAHLEAARAADPDSPAAMVSLGLAYHLQGRLKEAHQNYAEFTYLFENIFPELVFKISRYEYMIELGIKDPPPNWKEIYRYNQMHEL